MPTSLKQKLAIAAAAMAGIGAGTLGVTSALASPRKPVTPAAAVQAGPTTTAGPQSTATGPDATAEAPESSAEAPESANDPANEPGVVGTGHEDPPGQDVDHQFSGAE